MKKTISILTIILAFSIKMKAQVSLTATAGTASATYANLRLAFAAINNATHQGIINITITANTTETTSAKLDSSGNPSGSNWNKVTVTPSGHRSINGSDGQFLEFVGSDNVVIDGLNDGTNSLTLNHRSRAGSGGAIYCRYGMLNCKFTNLIINTAVRNAGGAAAFYFLPSSSANLRGKMQYDTISNNVIKSWNITDSACNTAIRIDGIGFNVGSVRDFIITGNKIENITHATAGSLNSNIYIIHIGDYSYNFKITDNHIYFPAGTQQLFNTSVSVAITGINLIISTDHGEEGTIIERNYIGGTQPFAKGGYWKILPNMGFNAENKFKGIVLAGTNDTLKTWLICRNNVIRKIDFATNHSGTASYTTFRTDMFSGIYFNSVWATATQDTIGSITDTASIIIRNVSNSTTAYTNFTAAGINMDNATRKCTIYSESVGGISLYNYPSAQPGHAIFTAIELDGNTGSRRFAKHNIVGGNVAHSIQLTYNTGNSYATLYGIYGKNAVHQFIDSNLVRNISILSGNDDSKIYGIASRNNNTDSRHNYTVNTVKNLISYSGGQIYGINAGIASSVGGQVVNFLKNTIDSLIDYSYGSNSRITGLGMGVAELYSGLAANPQGRADSNRISNILTPNRNSGSNLIYGIYNLYNPATKNMYMQNNIVENISVKHASVYGAYTEGYDFSNNIIRNIRVNRSRVGIIHGINAATVTNHIYKNKIYNLAVDSIGQTIYGIIGTGTNLNDSQIISNNMITLGNDCHQDAIIYGLFIYSIGSDTVDFHHNTVLICGNTSSGVNNTYALRTNNSGGILRAHSNILYNTRSGGTGNHLAINGSNTTVGTSGGRSTTDRNLLYTTDTSKIAEWIPGGPSILGFSAWKSTSGVDALSRCGAVVFIDTANGNLTTNSNIILNGAVKMTNRFNSDLVRDDYTGVVRTRCRDIGATEGFGGFAASGSNSTYKWIGGFNNSWCQPCNWDTEIIPPADYSKSVIITDSCATYPANACGNIKVNNYTMEGGSNIESSSKFHTDSLTLVTGNGIHVKGNINIQGSSKYQTFVLDSGNTQQINIKSATNTYPGQIGKLFINKTPASMAYLHGDLNCYNGASFIGGRVVSMGADSFSQEDASSYKMIYNNGTIPGFAGNMVNDSDAFFQGVLRTNIPVAYTGSIWFPLGFMQMKAVKVYATPLSSFKTYAHTQFTTGSSGAGTLTATYYDKDPDPTPLSLDGDNSGIFTLTDADPSYADGLDVKSDNIWHLENSGLSGFTYNQELYFKGLTATDFTRDELAVNPKLRLIKRSTFNSGAWGSQSLHDTSTILSYRNHSVKRNGLTTFSGFSFAGNGIPGLGPLVPLSIKWLNAYIQKINDKSAAIHWQIEIDEPIIYIEIERSVDGKSFYAIGKIKADNIENGLHSMKYNDNNTLTGLSFYRIKVVSIHHIEYSKIMSYRSDMAIIPITMFPNPSASNTYLNIAYNLDSEENQIEIINSIGQIVYAQNINSSNGILTIDKNLLPKGVLILRVHNQTQSISQKLILE